MYAVLESCKIPDFLKSYSLKF